MKIKGLFLLIILLLTFSVKSDTTFYGKLFVTLESQEMLTGTELNIENNDSRLGIKGNLELKRDVEVIYKAEYEVDPVDGKADESNGRTFKQRNTFIGFKGSLGTLFLGTHDTAFRKSQDKIDLFNDFEKIAALLKNIDLFITVSNSTAHLAGALGVPTWLIKPKNHAVFHYWNQPKNQTPWYNSINLFEYKDSWAETINQIKNEFYKKFKIRN